jgi:hypothetical protein
MKKISKGKARAVREDVLTYTNYSIVWWIVLGVAVTVGMVGLALAPSTLNVGERLFVAISGVVLGVLAAAYMPLWRTFRNERLIIGEDCLQIVVGSRDKVIGQIPYDNLAAVRVCAVSTGNEEEGYRWSHDRVEVSIYKRKRKDTWWPRIVKDEDFEVIIGDNYDTKPRKIVEMILARVEAYQTGN